MSTDTDAERIEYFIKRIGGLSNEVVGLMVNLKAALSEESK